MTEKCSDLQYADRYDPDEDFDSIYTVNTARRIKEFIGKGDRILELGSATSLMTSLICGEDVHIDCVERSPEYIDVARGRGLVNVAYHQSAVEDFATADRYDHILMTNLLHELPAPEVMLRKASDWLAPGGRLHVTVPNPESIHRKLALLSGMIKSLTEISARGSMFLTLRLFYNHEIIEMVGASAGLQLIHQDGVLFKPLPNSEMEKFDPKLLRAFDDLAHEFRDNSAMTYFVFGKQ